VSTTDAPLPDSPWPTAPPGAPGLKVGFPGAQSWRHQPPVQSPLHGSPACSWIERAHAHAHSRRSTRHSRTTPYCNPLKCQGPPIGQPRKGVNSQSAVGPRWSMALYTGIRKDFLCVTSAARRPDGFLWNRPDLLIQEWNGLSRRLRRLRRRDLAGAEVQYFVSKNFRAPNLSTSCLTR